MFPDYPDVTSYRIGSPTTYPNSAYPKRTAEGGGLLSPPALFGGLLVSSNDHFSRSYDIIQTEEIFDLRINHLCSAAWIGGRKD